MKISALALAGALIAGPASAVPYEFIYSSNVSGAFGVGGAVSAGQVATLSVIVDNGGTSSASQDWTDADAVSATFTAGSYSATWNSGFFAGSTFKTDLNGDLVSANFNGAAPTGSVGTLLNGVVATTGGGLIVFTSGTSTGSPTGGWTAPSTPSVSAVPVPAAFPLIATALGALFGFGALRRRKAGTA